MVGALSGLTRPCIFGELELGTFQPRLGFAQPHSFSTFEHERGEQGPRDERERHKAAEVEEDREKIAVGKDKQTLLHPKLKRTPWQKKSA